MTLKTKQIKKIVEENFLLLKMAHSPLHPNIQELNMSFILTALHLAKASSFTGHGFEVTAGPRIGDGNFPRGGHTWELKKVHTLSAEGS